MTLDQRITGWRLLLACALSAAIVFALLPQPPELPTSAWSDKQQHIAAFATLATLAALAYPRAPLLRIGERLSFLGAMIEVLQSIPALQRDCDVRDWIADTVAVAVVLLVFAAIRRRAAP